MRDHERRLDKLEARQEANVGATVVILGHDMGPDDWRERLESTGKPPAGFVFVLPDNGRGDGGGDIRLVAHEDDMKL